jgi:hypothetical protein
MMILAVDPGNEQSAYVMYDSFTQLPADFGIVDNADLLDEIWSSEADLLAVEMVASYGMAVGRHVFETCVWIGRIVQHWLDKPVMDTPFRFVYRKDVKMHLCGQTKAKDSNIRQAIMDRYGSTRQKVQGTKKSPGPLYGVSKDVWAALGVAITAAETKETDA